MKIKIQQMLTQNHSWAIVGQNLARAFKNHQVDLIPTDNGNHFPTDLKTTTINPPYDMQISYTIPNNFPKYLIPGKNKFAIWCYEFNNAVPKSTHKYLKYIDKLLVPSNFAKSVFLNAKYPEELLHVIPHGSNYKYSNNLNLTRKSYKIGAVFGQPHLRKNIPALITAYLNAFSNKDDTSLIIKIDTKKDENKSFKINFYNILNNIKSKYKSPAEIIVVDYFIPDMNDLYSYVNTLFTMSHAEGFYMPGLEAAAAGKLNIAPNYGGQLDFLNNNNSLLVEGKIVRAPNNYLYWENNHHAEMFQPNIEHATELLKLSYNKYDSFNNISNTVKDFTWENVANKILNLTQ